MRRALRLAAIAGGRAAPNPMVGCVLVKGGQVIGEGYHHRAGEPHAEVEALALAGRHARGATAFVTLEPCNHHGRTGPCTEALLAAGVTRVVAAMADPNPKVAGGGAARLRAAGVPVDIGLCEPEARALNLGFTTFITTGRPHVTLKAALTLDGRLATRGGDSRWVTGEPARAEVHRMRHAAGAILVGASTVMTDDPSLTTRPPKNRPGYQPLRVILDGRLRTPPTAKVVGENTLIVCAASASKIAERVLLKRKAEILRLRAPQNDARIDLAALLDALAKRNVLELLVEGGSQVHAAFLERQLADRLVAFIAPKIAGADGIPFARLPSPARMADAITLVNPSIRRFGHDVCIAGDLPRATG